jgi:hypothetical protein
MNTFNIVYYIFLELTTCAILFRALRTAGWWRWDTEEGHGDPS